MWCIISRDFTTHSCLVLTIFAELSRPRTIVSRLLWNLPTTALGWSTYSTMSMQIDRHSATFVSTSLGTPSREGTAPPSRRGHKSLPRVSKSLQSAKRVTFRAFLLLVTLPVLLTRHYFRRRIFFFSRRVTSYFSAQIYRSRKFPPVRVFQHEWHSTIRSRLFLPSLSTLGRFLRKVETFWTSFACILLRSPLARACPGRLGSTIQIWRKFSFRVKLMATTTTTRLNASQRVAVRNLADFWQRPPFGNAYKQRYSQHLPGHDP